MEGQDVKEKEMRGKTRAIGKKAASVVVALAMALTLTPLQALADGGDEASGGERGNLATSDIETLSETKELLPVARGISVFNEVQVLSTPATRAAADESISVTVPINVTFGDGNGYDVATNLNSVTSTGKFKNTGNTYARMTGITCNDDGAMAVLTGVSASTKIFMLTNGSNTVSFSPANGGNTVAANALGKNFDIPDNGTKEFTYTLDLSMARVNSSRADNGQTVQSLAKVVYTFAAATTSITWNPNGGTLSGTAPTTQYYSSSSTLTLPSAPTRTGGYTFLGWNTKSDGTGSPVTLSTKVPYDNVEYYAQWKSPNPLGDGTGDTSNDFYFKENKTGEVYTAAEIAKLADQMVSNPSGEVAARFEALMGEDVNNSADATTGYQCQAKYNGVYYDVRIIGINHDTASTGSKVGLTFQFVNTLPDQYPINGTDSNSGGWPKMGLRTSMNTANNNGGLGSKYPCIYDRMPASLKDAVKTVTKISYNYASKAGVTSTDKFFIASNYELCGSSYQNKIASSEDGYQYEYYKVKGKDGTGTPIVNYWGGSASNPTLVKQNWWWWERTCDSASSSKFFQVGNNGAPSHIQNATSPEGISPCFCL